MQTYYQMIISYDYFRIVRIESIANIYKEYIQNAFLLCALIRNLYFVTILLTDIFVTILLTDIFVLSADLLCVSCIYYIDNIVNNRI